MIKNKQINWASLVLIAGFVFWRIRKTDKVVSTNPPTIPDSSFLRSANVAPVLPPTIAPIFAAGYPLFEFNHVKFKLTNAGTFSYSLQKTGGAILESGTVAGPMSSIWTSQILPHDGQNYTLTINGNVSNLTALNDVQNSLEWSDQDTNDGTI